MKQPTRLAMKQRAQHAMKQSTCHEAVESACHDAATDSRKSTADPFIGLAAGNCEVPAESHHLDSLNFYFDFDEQEIVGALDRDLPFDPLCYMSPSIFPEKSSLFAQHNIETNEIYHLHDSDFAEEALEEVSPTGSKRISTTVTKRVNIRQLKPYRSSNNI